MKINEILAKINEWPKKVWEPIVELAFILVRFQTSWIERRQARHGLDWVGEEHQIQAEDIAVLLEGATYQVDSKDE